MRVASATTRQLRRSDAACTRLGPRASGEELAPEDQVLVDRYVAAVSVSGERLAGLAKARAERVRQLLVEKGVVAARIAAGEPDAEAKPSVVISFKAS